MGQAAVLTADVDLWCWSSRGHERAELVHYSAVKVENHRSRSDRAEMASRDSLVGMKVVTDATHQLSQEAKEKCCMLAAVVVALRRSEIVVDTSLLGKEPLERGIV